MADQGDEDDRRWHAARNAFNTSFPTQQDRAAREESTRGRSQNRPAARSSELPNGILPHGSVSSDSDSSLVSNWRERPALAPPPGFGSRMFNPEQGGPSFRTATTTPMGHAPTVHAPGLGFNFDYNVPITRPETIGTGRNMTTNANHGTAQRATQGATQGPNATSFHAHTNSRDASTQLNEFELPGNFTQMLIELRDRSDWQTNEIYRMRDSLFMIHDQQVEIGIAFASLRDATMQAQNQLVALTDRVEDHARFIENHVAQDAEIRNRENHKRDAREHELRRMIDAIARRPVAAEGPVATGGNRAAPIFDWHEYLYGPDSPPVRGPLHSHVRRSYHD